SALRVRDGGVRGLELHIDRIVAATHELFGVALTRERVRNCLRHAVGGRAGEWSVRVNVFSRALDRDRPAAAAAPDILVSVAPAVASGSSPLSVKSFAFTRTLAHVKHVGTFPLFHYRRLAQQAGCDDAVFVDADGAL